MAKFTPRTTAPSSTDKNWLHYNYGGGYNYCLHIGGGSCLPNCVGYAWGRWRELLGAQPKLSVQNAEDWWAHPDGYQRGQTPKLGAVVCWRKGAAGNSSDGAGHVAIVEKINSDGSILISQSAYNGTRFYTQTLKAPYVFGSAYTLQGFIYLPITYDDTTPKKEEDFMYYHINLTKDLKQGNSGDDVKKLQARVAQISPAYETEVRGHSINKTTGQPDGIFGAGLAATLKKVQKEAGVPVTGVLDAATRAVLNENQLGLHSTVAQVREIVK